MCWLKRRFETLPLFHAIKVCPARTPRSPGQFLLGGLARLRRSSVPSPLNGDR